MLGPGHVHEDLPDQCKTEKPTRLGGSPHAAALSLEPTGSRIGGGLLGPVSAPVRERQAGWGAGLADA